MKKKRIKCESGDVFTVVLKNGEKCFGQILDFQMTNIIRVAFFDGVFAAEVNIEPDIIIKMKVFSMIATDKHFMTAGEWPIIGSAPVLVKETDFPNEEFRAKEWVGSVHYSATLVEEFLNAYYGLTPWDDYFDPNYLDKFLLNPNDKPHKLIYSKK